MKSIKKMTLFELMDHVSEKAQGCHFGKLSRVTLSKHVNALAVRLGIPQFQALLLSVCLKIGPMVSTERLAEYFSVSRIRILMHTDDIGALVRVGYLKYETAANHDVFGIPDTVVQSLFRNQTPRPPRRTGLSVSELFDRIDELFRAFDEGSPNGMDLVEELNTLLSDNKNLPFVKAIDSLKLPSLSNRTVIVALCHFHINRKQEEIDFSRMRGAFSPMLRYFKEKGEMKAGEHYLIKEGLVELADRDKDAESIRVHLTEKAKMMLLPGYSSKKTEKPIEGLITPDELTEKTLFYTDRNATQIDELGSLLMPDNYDGVISRLGELGFRKGFAFLFYGPAGLGKTETVNQLARLTGRGIMPVNIAEIKNKWVGDSEKNIKAVFDRYRSIVRSAKQAPILLFNEADGILGIRMKGASEEVDKMQSAIQNIILQEMEDLEGILIATTNLSENLDKAFERRFLYKIRFDRPDAQVRSKIWRQMIPSLDETQSTILAKSYDFSGGQIENIARKYMINIALHGDDKDIMESLESYCDSELLEVEKRPRVGF